MPPQVWLPGRDTLEEGEALQYDPTVYDCMSSMGLDWPCLSFDLLRDHLGAPRTAFPHTLFMVAGTQASSSKLNYLGIMKVSNLTQGKHGQVRSAGNKVSGAWAAGCVLATRGLCRAGAREGACSKIWTFELEGDFRGCLPVCSPTRCWELRRCTGQHCWLRCSVGSVLDVLLPSLSARIWPVLFSVGSGPLAVVAPRFSAPG